MRPLLYAEDLEGLTLDTEMKRTAGAESLKRILPSRCPPTIDYLAEPDHRNTQVCQECHGTGIKFPSPPDWWESRFNPARYPTNMSPGDAWKAHLTATWRALGLIDDFDPPGEPDFQCGHYWGMATDSRCKRPRGHAGQHYSNPLNGFHWGRGAEHCNNIDCKDGCDHVVNAKFGQTQPG